MLQAKSFSIDVRMLAQMGEVLNHHPDREQFIRPLPERFRFSLLIRDQPYTNNRSYQFQFHSNSNARVKTSSEYGC
ncbi:protein of unknown function [Xenorhabdus poinarii G6]|uniref:Uncharacterized protein n=1 Tax=Xenorhabdus poinarii G6 TaxID=1354304 RepID=A0A068R3J1_9GAMM|nr:protein of unknown function [Xenorhabdus poinarii G6]